VNIADMRVVAMGMHTVGVLVHPASEASTEATNEQPDASAPPSPPAALQTNHHRDSAPTKSGIDNAD
jgi:hypothetical protein